MVIHMVDKLIVYLLSGISVIKETASRVKRFVAIIIKPFLHSGREGNVYTMYAFYHIMKIFFVPKHPNYSYKKIILKSVVEN